MHSIFLLYGLTFVPVSGAYGPAIDKAREAAFVQSGIKSDFEVAKKAAERRIPKELIPAAFAYQVVRKGELRLKSREWGNWRLRRDSAEFSFSFEF